MVICYSNQGKQIQPPIPESKYKALENPPTMIKKHVMGR